MRAALALVVILPFFGCGDDTGSNRQDGPSTLPDGRSPDAAPDAGRPIDAAPPQFGDGNNFTTPTTDNQVGCPTTANGNCDSTMAHCCGGAGGLSCVSNNFLDAGACSAGVDEGCDGTEDCTSGQ